jgi:hypothetical protein
MHTGAPWVVRWRNGRLTTVIGRQRFPICDTGTSPPGQADPRREEANAFLISAAPDGLKAALAALDFLHREYACANSSALDGDPLAPAARQLRDQLCAFVAKAHGADQ